MFLNSPSPTGHGEGAGYVELSVVIEARDISCLLKLKQRYGGYIRSTYHSKAIRYRLHNKKAILHIISETSIFMLNPVRLKQLHKVQALYNLKANTPLPLSYNSAYFSGFFDGPLPRDQWGRGQMEVFILIKNLFRFLLV